MLKKNGDSYSDMFLDNKTLDDIRKIDTRFKSAKTLNMAYEWCMLYEGARKRDKAVSEGAKVSSDLDDKAKTYGKK